MRAGRPRKIGPRKPSGDLTIPRPHPGKSAIYVVEIQDGIVKIGRSANPFVRVEELGRANPRVAILFCCFWMDSFDAVGIEREIHQKLRKTNVHARGEVYYLDAETAVALIKTIIGERAIVDGIERFEPEIPIKRRISPSDLTTRRWYGLKQDE